MLHHFANYNVVVNITVDEQKIQFIFRCTTSLRVIVCEKISTRASIQTISTFFFSWRRIWSTTSERVKDKKVHTQPGHDDQEEVIKCSIYIFIQARVHSEKFLCQILNFFQWKFKVLFVYIFPIVCYYRVNLCLGLRVIKSIIVSVCLISNSYKNKRKKRDEIKKSWKL